MQNEGADGIGEFSGPFQLYDFWFKTKRKMNIIEYVSVSEPYVVMLLCIFFTINTHCLNLTTTLQSGHHHPYNRG